MRKYWFSALAIFAACVTYAVAGPFVFGGGTLGYAIWPLLGTSLVLHFLTILYVILRPELCTMKRKSKLRWQNPHNYLAMAFTLLEFAQLASVPFSSNVPWLHEAAEEAGAGETSSAFVTAVQRAMHSSLILFESEFANLVRIRSTRRASPPVASLLTLPAFPCLSHHRCLPASSPWHLPC